jgi:putative ABC transport system permease protein
MAPMGYAFVIHVGLDPGDTRRLESHGEAGSPRILAGRDLGPGDRGKDVAVIGQQYAEAIGIRPEDVEAGTATMTIDPKQYNSIVYPLDRPARQIRVVGIYASGYVFGDQQLFMPLETLREIYGVDDGALTWVYARVDSVDNVAVVGANLHQKIGGVADVIAPYQVANFTAGTSRTVTRLAGIGSGVALALMIIVVFFVLLLQVRERAGEIGTLKAIGASNGGVAVQFLTEAVALAVLGGLLGVVLFWSLGEALTGGLFALAFEPFLSPAYGSLFDSLAVQTGVSEAVLGSALGAATLAAALGSAYGIWQVIRLSPLEAMNYE